MDFVKAEMDKEFNAVGFKNQSKIIKELDQVGKSNVRVDKKREALPAGKRISRTGKVYWETRKNRSDARGSKV